MQEDITATNEESAGVISTETLMRSATFRRGVEEVRAGIPPDFDTHDSWNYERGRQFGLIAPRSMPLYIDDVRLNPKAVTLFNRAHARGWITNER
jgi:hypothetical protein